MQLGVAVEPQIAARPEPELVGVLGEEIERRAAGLDVDGLPPRRARAARVELRRGVQPREIEIDDGDAARAALRERPGEARADDAASDDQDLGAVGRQEPPTSFQNACQLGHSSGSVPRPA